MADARLDLHKKLLTLVPNVYFQPPASVKLVYPCIIYETTDILTTKANDGAYQINKVYGVTLIERDVASMLSKRLLLEIPHSSHSSSYVVDNLYHNVFRVYTIY